MAAHPAGAAPALPGGRAASIRPMAECEALFDELAAPTEGMLNGVYRGRVAGLPGSKAQPGPLQRLLSATIPHARFPWYGKGFDGASGANVWLNSTGRFQRFGYDVAYRPDAVWLSYDRPDNPRMLRGLRAEVRVLAPGRYLCRALNRDKTLLYFTLES